MKLLIKNATIISMDKQRDKIEYDTDILIEDNIIKQIGKKIRKKVDKTIDAAGKVVMPGFVNTHAHVPMCIFRETLDGYNLQDWLSKKIWPMERSLTFDDIYYASYLTFIEMIKTGTTTVNDMYFETDAIIKAMKETGVRLQTTVTLRNNDNDGEKRFNDFKKILENYYNTDSKLTFNAGIHGLYTTTSSYVDKCLALSKKYNINVHLHFCENLEEIKDIKRQFHKEPVNVLLKYFINTPFKPILAHCVCLTQDDIKKLNKINANISHCPISNLRLGCGVANIDYMLNQGLNVSLGTDGQGSGSSMDMFETMKYTALLQKGKTRNPESMPSYEVLKMATINGAKALGLDDIIGSIAENKVADLIIVDIDDITIKPVNDLISELVYNVKGSNVWGTIIDGNVLMENKTLLNIDENKIINKVDEIYKRISK